MNVRPPVLDAPMIALLCRVAPERRAELLAFLREAFPVYERPPGVRMALYEAREDPTVIVELVLYASEEAFEADQERVRTDPEMAALLGRWRGLLDGPPQVLSLRSIRRDLAVGERSEPWVEQAAFNDHPAIVALLQGAGLPVPDAADAPVRMLVARERGVAIGCVGVEIHADGAVLRSLAVRADARRRGVGAGLARAALENLAPGSPAAFLLTQGAAGFFEQLGFERLAREEVPEHVRASGQFSGSCCASAVAMRKLL